MRTNFGFCQIAVGSEIVKLSRNDDIVVDPGLLEANSPQDGLKVVVSSFFAFVPEEVKHRIVMRGQELCDGKEAF